MARTNFPGLAQAGDRPERVALAVNSLLLGKMNCSFELTLTASAASTTVEDPRINESSGFNFDPRSAHAAAELGNGTMFVSAVSKGSVTITHANNAQSDRIFVVSVFH